LAKAFNEGIKMLPQILSAIPEMVKAFNDALTDEATRRVEEKMLKNNEGKDEESLKEDDKEANNMSKEAETVKEEGVSASAPESGIENGQAGGIKTE
jgi:Sec-independent protein translocase protein TatA